MTNKYYGRAWIRNGAVYTLNTTSKPIPFDTFTDWSDEVIEFEINGQYETADLVLGDLSYSQNGLAAATRTITVTATRPGVVRNVDAELSAMRERLSLTFAQLLIGLVTEGWITEAEGEAWLTGTLPAPVLSLIATLPAGQQFAAKARAIAPSVVLRNDALVVALGAAQGKTPEQIDAFFTTYAQV